MPPRHKVDQLPREERDFVIECLLDGQSQLEVSQSYEDKFGKALAKSSLDRWWAAKGKLLVDQCLVIRQVGSEVVNGLRKEPDADKYEVVMEHLQDWMLNALPQVTKTEPVKLILIQQEEKRRNLHAQKLALEERKQTFAEEQARKAEQLQHDRFKIGADAWQFVLSFLLGKEPQAADLLTKHSEEILNGLETHLENQSA